ncbi:thioredoxin-like 4, chloroplastic [Selaginella moellendorffii]|uniref:thioredoxin-like 4, chloroplastic n=1 Tax=Selaginella moellendorffii TaxID=88036 RepID=UPI000D1CE5FC|nr:thioredoxin-like 4, chloroplastic [Selaginella moellendorffii]|eukprot:XP_024534646.1 thioredoxin-like 4, chloroplastic [Selaginella moellendorffii]
MAAIGRDLAAFSIVGSSRFVGGKRSWFQTAGIPGTPHRNVACAGIQVDRKRHLEESLKRQEEADARRAEAEISCPVDCVTVVSNLQEFDAILERAREEHDLVVVDFYNTSCGACKYMLPQFVKLCKRGCSSDECVADPQEDDEHSDESQIVFVKHNVLDDYDELTDLAEFYSVSSVPLFAIFQDGCLVDKFATRDKHRLERAVCQLLHAKTTPQEGDDTQTS